LADPSISRHHAVIRRTAAGYEVQDLQSSNGVLVNGTRLSTAIMRDGDRVTMGQIQMTFVDPVSAEAMATMAVPIGEPMSPLGTVRMDPSEMAKIQGLGLGSAPQAPVPAPPAPPAPPLMPVAPPPPQAPPRKAPVGPPPRLHTAAGFRWTPALHHRPRFERTQSGSRFPSTLAAPRPRPSPAHGRAGGFRDPVVGAPD
jgi:predicted component of type VI protein secretion system